MSRRRRLAPHSSHRARSVVPQGNDTRLARRWRATGLLLSVAPPASAVALFATFPHPYLVLLYCLAMVLSGVIFADRILLWRLGARRLASSQEALVHQLSDRLSHDAGVPSPHLAIRESQAATAIAMGRNPRHAVLVISRGLLWKEPATIEQALATQINQIKERGGTGNTLANAVSSFVDHLLGFVGR